MCMRAHARVRVITCVCVLWPMSFLLGSYRPSKLGMLVGKSLVSMKSMLSTTRTIINASVGLCNFLREILLYS